MSAEFACHAKAPPEWSHLTGLTAAALVNSIEYSQQSVAAHVALEAVHGLHGEEFDTNLYFGLTLGAHRFAETVYATQESEDAYTNDIARILVTDHEDKHHGEEHTCEGLYIGEVRSHDAFRELADDKVRSDYDTITPAERIILEALAVGRSADETFPTGDELEGMIHSILQDRPALDAIAAASQSGIAQILRVALYHLRAQQTDKTETVEEMNGLPISTVASFDTISSLKLDKAARTIATLHLSETRGVFRFTNIATHPDGIELVVDHSKLSAEPDPSVEFNTSQVVGKRHAQRIGCPVLRIFSAIPRAAKTLPVAVNLAQRQLVAPQVG